MHEIDHMPALVVGGAANYQIIGRVRIYFNRLPSVDPTKISNWELSPQATAYGASSLPIATLSYTTHRHFSTYFGSTISVFSRAWGSPPANVHDVYECRSQNRNPLFGVDFDPGCKAGPDADSPVQALVAKSVDIDAEKGAQTKTTINELVHNGLSAVVGNRSQV